MFSLRIGLTLLAAVRGVGHGICACHRGGSMSLSLSNRQTRFSPRCRRVSIWTSLSLVFPRLWVCMRCTARCQKIRAPRQRSVTEARADRGGSAQ